MLILPLRSPFVTALSLATASRLSDDRVLLGVGSGWMREEFEHPGEDFDTRGPRLDECLEVVDGLLSGAEFSTTVDSSTSALRRLVRRGDGWFGPSIGLSESVAAAAESDRLRADSPRPTEPITHFVRLFGPASSRKLSAYQEAGFEHVVVSGGPLLKGADTTRQREDLIHNLTEAAGELG